ncbi:MAG: hypothetical protein EXQ77_00920 [Thermoleophilia bacterium]|nr:hypothetical protein [Thermoleophilia bacterium]
MGPMGVWERRAVGRAALGVALAVVLIALAAPARADDASPPAQPAEPPVVPVPVRQLIEAGMTIAGQPVGGLNILEAVAIVRQRFERPLTLVVSPGSVRTVAPAELGARARVGFAVDTALKLGFAFDIPLAVEFDEIVLRRAVERIQLSTSKAPVAARIVVRGREPHVVSETAGRTLQTEAAVRLLRGALERHVRSPLRLPFRATRARVTEAEPGFAIIILRESRRLSLFHGERLQRTFRVATGLAAYPTPLGRWRLVVKERDPWWHPPPGSDWAVGKEPVPPGPGNPLGTRWMGLDAQYVGIHGTPDAASIGYSASHGCIRMLIPEVEWLFDRVPVGTPVFILPV